MSLKAKIMSAIIALVLSISTLIVGVVALKNANFNVQGSINFTAKGVNALVSYAGLENCTFIDGTVAPIQIDFSTKHEVANLESAKTSWTGLKLQFNETTTFPYKAKLKLSIKNNGVAGEYLLANIVTTSENVKVSPNNITVAPDATQNYTITFTLNSNVDTTIGFDLTFNLSLSSEEVSANIKYDTTSNYYYINMGSYNDTPIRWRYIGYVDASGKYVGFNGNPNEAPSTKGIFLQETEVNSKAFDSSGSVEYATSEIRSYLRGNVVSDFNLASDENYQKVIARTLTNLYSEMDYNNGTGAISDRALPSGANGNETDKLWLMSAKEVYNVIGGYAEEASWSEATTTLPTGGSFGFTSDLMNRNSWLRTAYYSDTPCWIASGGIYASGPNGTYALNLRATCLFDIA